jgi:hypothetical protein
MLLALILLLGDALASEHDDRRLERQRAVLWEPYVAWPLHASGLDGNPYDVVATATFEHAASGARHTTPLFHAGEDRWEFRFTGTRTGTWTFSTRSAVEPLDGWHGEVEIEPNPDPAAEGFLTTFGRHFAAPIDEDGTLAARTYHVYMNPAFGELLDGYPTESDALARAADEMLDEVEAHGFDAMFVIVLNSWFSFGARSHTDHDSEDPSPLTFAVLETLILRAHERGLSVHIWAWGDEERRWTPIGVGGINGVADRRLQRYIAARLGPLPGWTMSYGFDLEEWVTPDEVRSWAEYLHQHMGWPRLLMAREAHEGVRADGRVFDLADEKLDVFSSDERPEGDFFDTALALQASTDVPLFFERRFLHTRDGVWDMDTTRRALWQFTLAGGTGAVWGRLFDDGPPYPEPEHLRTYQAFWRERLGPDLTVAEPLTGVADGYLLRNQEATRAVFYVEATAQVPFVVPEAAAPHSAVAIDTRSAYQEIDLGVVAAGEHVWIAPYESDWVVAVGGT